jgi:GNAT superfamily N-acetyltransferase
MQAAQFLEVSRADFMKLAVQSGMVEADCLLRHYEALLDGVRRLLCRSEVGDHSILEALVQADAIYAAVEPSPASKRVSFENASLVDKKLAGLCLTSLDYSSPGQRPHCAYLSLFCAAPAAHGAHVGKRFMAFVQDQLFRRGVVVVSLHTSSLAAYMKFYEKMGFRCTKLYPDVASVYSSMQYLAKIAPEKRPSFFLSFQDHDHGTELPSWGHRADLMSRLTRLTRPPLPDRILGETCLDDDPKTLFDPRVAKRVAGAWTGPAKEAYQTDMAAYRASIAPGKSKKRAASASPPRPPRNAQDARRLRVERRDDRRVSGA